MLKKINYAWLIMISCCAITTTAIGIVNGCVGIFLKPISEELGVGIGSISVFVTIQLLVSSLLMPIAGNIMKKFDLRFVLSIAGTLQIGTFMMLSQLHSTTSFYIAGAILGTSSPFIAFLAVPALMNAWFKKKLGILMGITFAFSGLGAALFSAIGGHFIALYGWRTTYLLLGGIGAVIMLPLLYFVVREKPSDKGLLPYGVEKTSLKMDKKNLELSGITAKLAVKSWVFYLALFSLIFLALATSIANHLPSYLMSIGYDETIAASVLSIYMIGVVAGKLIVGLINDKFGILNAFYIIEVTGSIGVLLLIMHPGGLPVIFVGAVLMGLIASGGTIIPPLLTRTLFGEKDFSIIYSYMSMGVSVTSGLGVSIYGFIYDFSGSYLINLLIVLAAIMLSLLNATLSIKSVFRQKLEY